MMRRSQIGCAGEAECRKKLSELGWNVIDLNLLHGRQVSNADLQIEKGEIRHLIQVKTSFKRRGYITGGGVNAKIVDGSSIFNRDTGAENCDFVIFLSDGLVSWRYFIVPVTDAEAAFRRNISAYFLNPRLDGGARSPSGQSDIFVGSGSFPHSRIVPDQREEILPFEDRWDLLER